MGVIFCRNQFKLNHEDTKSRSDTWSPSTASCLRGFVVVILMFSAFGCDRDDQIVTHQAPKAQARPAAEATKPQAANAPPATDAGIKWTLPRGWVEQSP